MPPFRCAPSPLVLAVAAALGVLACVDEEREVAAGTELYGRYCASCHGEAGRGDGPVAVALTTAPADLTRIAARHGGRFPEAQVMATIDGRRLVAVHGTREMPVWGAVFESEHAGQPYAAYTALLDSRALTDYLRVLQAE